MALVLSEAQQPCAPTGQRHHSSPLGADLASGRLSVRVNQLTASYGRVSLATQRAGYSAAFFFPPSPVPGECLLIGEHTPLSPGVLRRAASRRGPLDGFDMCTTTYVASLAADAALSEPICRSLRANGGYISPSNPSLQSLSAAGGTAASAQAELLHAGNIDSVHLY